MKTAKIWPLTRTKMVKKSADMMDAGAEKVREACIAMKEKMGGDVSECDSKD